MDLPLIKAKPSYQQIKAVLNRIPSGDHVWDLDGDDEKRILNWLVGLIATNMEWIDNTDEKEELLVTICQMIAERSGRLAAPTKVRTFTMNNHKDIRILEPSLTYDTLGFKTWGSAPLLSAHLPEWETPNSSLRALELGSGTGLLGISAAHQLGWQMVCTDLPEIVKNMEHNVLENEDLVHENNGAVECHVLDWMNPPPDDDLPNWLAQPFERIIASDCVYETNFGRLAIALFLKYLAKDGIAITEYPLRQTHLGEIAEFEELMHEAGFVRETGEETGQEDFGSRYPVACRWSRWRYSNSK
ncbi:translation elongation factor EF2/EF3 lysine methyltransferase Efm2/Rgg1 [Schizosaccharomyces osmophilus]|uniref:Translation elongation factor EF2/EF3 lysine methyltransferase Efm2/Rgg1 n=1 Tax=Schizosaccharomyces osmophilus TaxID=2545709 RepID=A0AAF0AZ50_9SCHI|nr:translation elongation factor EF2/EF3 lysine methyltransferase Efm2/Rgg1 [Schizosaccharomyces osmophilus]WBW75079.1 translation elongation factor EF2/EF3 lysine methyltransferase Efm2/Rgg1 [Schizosaccharomyces osmophilus]